MAEADTPTPDAGNEYKPKWHHNPDPLNPEHVAAADEAIASMGRAPTGKTDTADEAAVANTSAALNAHQNEAAAAVAGSPGMRDAILQWGQNNLSAEDMAAYNELTQDPTLALKAFKELRRRFLAARGH